MAKKSKKQTIVISNQARDLLDSMTWQEVDCLIKQLNHGNVLKLDKEFPKAKSWHELYKLAEADDRYKLLIICGLENLGNPTMIGGKEPKWKRAWNGLQEYIMALVGEYGESESKAEQQVLDEVNSVRDCIDQVSLLQT